jgi:hypothetical protein
MTVCFVRYTVIGMRLTWLIPVGCAALACGPAVSVPGDAETESATTSSTTSIDPSAPTSSPTTTGVPPSTTVGTTLDDTSDVTGSDSSSGNEGSFIVDPDGSVCSCECDVWAQDCPRGEKCMPWVNDGGNAWNAVRCSPIDPDPAAPGEPCVAEDSGLSGRDNCELGSMCWGVDPDTLEGTCVGFCTGSEDAPVCGPDDRCSISNDGVLILCLPACDPVLADCDAGEICRPLAVQEDWVCMPAGGELAGYGEPCEDLFDCGAGLHCVPAQQMQGVAACTPEATSCCTAFCDVTDGPAGCPDAALGQACFEYYADPPLGETLGVGLIE